MPHVVGSGPGDDDEVWPWSTEFAPEGTYLATASVGLPPRRTVAALGRTIELWARGEVTPDHFEAPVEESRELYARLCGVPAEHVAVGNQTSPFVGLVASALPDGARVVVPEGEFASVPVPFTVHARRGVTVTEVPGDGLADAVSAGTDLVAFALVRSSDGLVVDTSSVLEAARSVGARTLADTTQAVGWLPVDAGRFDWTVCSAYKWLLSPRGTAFLTARPETWEAVPALAAGWFSGEPDGRGYYGADAPQAATARRYDVSPAWQAWVGTRASLGLIVEVGAAALHAHALACEAAFAEAAGLDPAGRAIVSVETHGEVAALLARERIATTTRAGRLRLAFHVNNTVAESRRVGELLRGHVRR